MRDCDYIIDAQGTIGIVKGYWNEDVILYNKVFAPDAQGNRYNPELKQTFSKIVENDHRPSTTTAIQAWFDPKQKFKESIDQLTHSVWGHMVDAFLTVGIRIEDIGIMGSYLVGFPVVKDIDFVIYGDQNCKKLQESISQVHSIVGSTPITSEHIAYQIARHGKGYSMKNSFSQLLANKWSSLQIAPGTLSTVRFVHDSMPENPFASPVCQTIDIQGKVSNSFGSNFCPRVFTVQSDSQEYTVATYFWIYQSCVKDGMHINVHANLRKDGTVTLDEYDHSIEVLE